MKFTFCAILTSAATTLAFADPEGHEYRASGPLDSRSPCPGLNALANHGYLPHDGKDLDYEMINKASLEAYNFAPGFYIDPVNQVFQLGISTTNRPNETFNLLDLARHDKIESDGSLTRNDIFFGDDVHFDASVFAPIAKDLGLNQHHRADRYVTPETAAKATKNRLDLAKTVNLAFNASAAQHSGEYVTTALYLLTVWDEQKQASPKSWVRALLVEDRIPYKEGYSKGQSLKTLEQIGNLTGVIRGVAGWKP